MITLSTLPQATAQEVFDQAAKHMLNQNRKSLSAANNCAYRGLDGLKCPAGCFISDEEYRPRMEGETWTYLTIKGLVPGQHRPLIYALQCIHDGKPVEEWRSKLQKIAIKYDLEFNI